MKDFKVLYVLIIDSKYFSQKLFRVLRCVVEANEGRKFHHTRKDEAQIDMRYWNGKKDDRLGWDAKRANILHHAIRPVSRLFSSRKIEEVYSKCSCNVVAEK